MEKIKTIIENLNKPPFNKNFNMITFDSLTQQDLLQILSDVLQQINDQDIIDIHREAFDDTLSRIFNYLLIFKYKPFIESSLDIQQNLAQSDKATIHTLLEWLFTNIEELKNRAYLARYLIRIDIPNDILGDSDIASLYQQYLQLLDEFKLVHQESVVTRNNNRSSVSELRSEGTTMEKEKEIVSNRIYTIHKKVDNIPNAAALLRSCHDLRVEHDRKKQISWQMKDEIAMAQQNQQRLYRLNHQIQELKKYSANLTPQLLLKKLEEEIYVTSYIANQKLPRELSTQKREKNVLEKITSTTNITKSTNDSLKSQLQSTSSQINQLLENRLSANTNDDQTIMYKQQAAIITRKKDSCIEKYSQLKNQLQDINGKLQDKQQELESIIGENSTILKDNEKFQEYVNKLRGRSLIYKRYRSEFSNLKAESEDLKRTLDTLRNKAEKLGITLEDTQQFINADENIEDTEMYNNESLLSLIKQLTVEIDNQKIKLTPTINRVKSIQEEIRYLQLEHDEKKRIYDRTNLSLNTNLMKLVNDVNQLEEQHTNDIIETKLMEENSHIAQVKLERAKREFQASIDKNTSTQLIKDRLNAKIAECEQVNRLLKEEQTEVHENENRCIDQREIWSNLNVLISLKISWLKREDETLQNVMYLENSETLVLGEK